MSPKETSQCTTTPPKTEVQRLEIWTYKFPIFYIFSLNHLAAFYHVVQMFLLHLSAFDHLFSLPTLLIISVSFKSNNFGILILLLKFYSFNAPEMLLFGIKDL